MGLECSIAEVLAELEQLEVDNHKRLANHVVVELVHISDDDMAESESSTHQEDSRSHGRT